MSIFDMLNQKQQEYRAASGNRAETTKLPDGESRWRIYPTWRKGADLNNTPFWHDFGQHFVRAPWDGQGEKPKPAVYICTQKTFKKECPVCAQLEAGMASSNDQNIYKALKDAKASGRVLVNAVRVDGAEPNKVHLLELAPSAFDSFTDGVRACHMEGQNVLCLDNGFDVMFTKSGTGLNTKYTSQIVRNSTPANKALMDQLHDLDEYCKQEHQEGLNKALTAVQNARGVLAGPATQATYQQAQPEAIPQAQAIPQQAVNPAQPAQQAYQQAQPETVIEPHQIETVEPAQPAQQQPIQQPVQTTIVEPATQQAAAPAPQAYEQPAQQAAPAGGVPQPSPEDLDAILGEINSIQS